MRQQITRLHQRLRVQLFYAIGCIVLMNCILTPLDAATYYVSTEGNNSWDGTAAVYQGGTTGPWLTLDRAGRSWSPGDTIYLRGGTYTGSEHITTIRAENSGTAGAPVTIAAYPGETPIFSGQPVHYPILLRTGTSYIVLDGLTFENNFRHLLVEGAVHIVVQNCTFGTPYWNEAEQRWNGDWSGVRVWRGAQYNVFRNNIHKDWGYITANWDDRGTPFGLGDWSDEADNTWYNLVEYCQFHRGGHDSFALGGAFNVIRHNYFRNENWLMPTPDVNPPDPKGFGLEKWGNRNGEFDGKRVERNVIEYNRFHYTGVPPDQDRGGFGIELGIGHSILRFNTIIYSWAAGLYFVGNSEENYVYHNTIWRNSRPEDHVYPLDSGFTGFGGGIIMSTYRPETRTKNRIVNNIVYQNGYRDIAERVKEWQIVRANHLTEMGDPLFVNTGGFGDYEGISGLPDLRLLPESPAIDAGEWLAFITSASGSGSSFTVDDAGYFSDGNRIVEGDLIQLQGQSQTARITSINLSTNRISLDRSLSWTNGQGVALAYNGSAPDMGAFEASTGRAVPAVPSGLRVVP